MVIIRSSAMRRPLRSRREMISPTRRRSTASGLHRTRVLSVIPARYLSEARASPTA